MYGLLAIRPFFEFSSGLLANCRTLAYMARYRSSASRDLLSMLVTAGGWEHICGIEQLLNIEEHLWVLWPAPLVEVADLVTSDSNASPLGQTTITSPVLSTESHRLCSLSLPVSVLADIGPDTKAQVLHTDPSSESCSVPAAYATQ